MDSMVLIVLRFVVLLVNVILSKHLLVIASSDAMTISISRNISSTIPFLFHNNDQTIQYYQRNKNFRYSRHIASSLNHVQKKLNVDTMDTELTSLSYIKSSNNHIEQHTRSLQAGPGTGTGTGTSTSTSTSIDTINPYFTMTATFGNNAMGEYNPDIAISNPLKGLCESPRYHYKSLYVNNMNASLEFYYIGLNEVMVNNPDIVGESNAFNWTVLDKELTNSANRKMHTILRFLVHFPGKPLMVPPYLIKDGIELRWYSATDLSPYYGDRKLLKAFEQFITALGKRYDGDKRIAVIQMGLLGFWGEWHTNRVVNLLPISTLDQINGWFRSAFKTTRIQARQNTQPVYDAGFGFHDDSFAFTTLDGWSNGGVTVNWYFWPKIIQANHTNFYRWAIMGGETRPELQTEIFNPWYSARTFQRQDFLECIRVTHTTYMFHHDAFKDSGYSGDQLWHARNAHARMGYNFQVVEVKARYLGTGSVDVFVTIKQMGVAPFYYPLRLYLGCPGMAWRRLYTDVEKYLIAEGDTNTWNFLDLPATTTCLDRIELSLDSPYAYPGRPIKFSQSGITDTGSIVIRIPLPDNVATTTTAPVPIPAPVPVPAPVQVPVPVSIPVPVPKTVPIQIVNIAPIIVPSPNRTSTPIQRPIVSPITVPASSPTSGPITLPRGIIAGFILMDTRSTIPRPIRSLVGNQIINLTQLGTQLSIGVNTATTSTSAQITSIDFQWIDNMNKPKTHREFRSPWVMTADDGAGNNWNPCDYIRYPGIKSIRVSASINNVVVDVVTLTFTVIERSQSESTLFTPNVFTGITLMNTSSVPATVLKPLEHGETIDIAKYGNAVSIRADTTRGRILNALARVEFTYKDPISGELALFPDSNAPYALAGGFGTVMNPAEILYAIGDKSIVITALFWNDTITGLINTTLFVVDSSKLRTATVVDNTTTTSVSTRFILMQATPGSKQIRVIHKDDVIALSDVGTELSIHVEFDNVLSSSIPITQVAFTWDTMEHTEYESPWSMGTNIVEQTFPVSYLSEIGTKHVSIVAYSNGRIVTEQSIVFDII